MYIVDLSMSFFHPKLAALLVDLEEMFGAFTVTSLWRRDGVHQTIPLRAVDLRCWNLTVGREIERWLNERWTYDPTRPGFEVCLYHDTGQGIHLHVQAHDNTSRRI